MLVIGPLGRALRGDASIAPYIPFTDGTVGRGLDPSTGDNPAPVRGVGDAAPYIYVLCLQ